MENWNVVGLVLGLSVTILPQFHVTSENYYDLNAQLLTVNYFGS